MLKLML